MRKNSLGKMCKALFMMKQIGEPCLCDTKRGPKDAYRLPLRRFSEVFTPQSYRHCIDELIAYRPDSAYKFVGPDGRIYFGIERDDLDNYIAVKVRRGEVPEEFKQFYQAS